MDHRKYVERYLKKVEEEIAEPNRTLMREFIAQCEAEKLSESRILEHLRALYKMESILGKPFPEASRSDTVRIINYLESLNTKHRGYAGRNPRIVRGKLSENYILGFKITLKKFYKWLNDGEEYPDCIRWLKCRKRGGPKVEKKDVLTGEEIGRIINACSRLRDRCFIHMTYEIGARAGEMLELKRKDVEFTGDGAVVSITNEKYRKGTGRHIPIVFSVPDLVTYMNSMANKDPDGYLWVCEGRKNIGNRISMTAMEKIFKRAAEKAGMEKRVWLHLLRHCRCTHVSHLLTDAVKREMFNWSEKSDMPGYYTHLSSRQAQDSILANVYGIKNGESVDIFCRRCKAKLPNGGERCWRCNLPLDERKIADEQSLMAELKELRHFRQDIKKLIDGAVKKKLEDMGLEEIQLS
jgi:integrase